MAQDAVTIGDVVAALVSGLALLEYPAEVLEKIGDNRAETDELTTKR